MCVCVRVCAFQLPFLHNNKVYRSLPGINFVTSMASNKVNIIVIILQLKLEDKNKHISIKIRILNFLDHVNMIKN